MTGQRVSRFVRIVRRSRAVASSVPGSSGRFAVAVAGANASPEPAHTNHGTEEDLEHDGSNGLLDGNLDKGIERKKVVHTAWLENCRPLQDSDAERFSGEPCQPATTSGRMSAPSNTRDEP